MRVVPVSVAIPVHNGGAMIADAIQSVFDQTWTPEEVIVVDDGSTDDTEAAVSQFKEVVFVRQRQQGAAEARNSGVRRATMPYIAFLDADDIWPKTRIELQLAKLIEDPMLDLVSGSMVPFRRGSAGEIVPLSPPSASRLPSVLLMRREAFLKVGAFSSQWEVGETIDWWSRAVDAGLRSAALPDVVLMRRVHAQNLGRTTAEPSRAYLQMLRAVINRRRESGSRSD